MSWIRLTIKDREDGGIRVVVRASGTETQESVRAASIALTALGDAYGFSPENAVFTEQVVEEEV